MQTQHDLSIRHSNVKNMQTEHAAKRSQQRGIPLLVQNWLLDYGEEKFSGNGVIFRYFTSKSIRNMERDFGREPLRRLSEYLRCYLVESSHDGSIITVGKRYKNGFCCRA